jgi:hypothetical protein
MDDQRRLDLALIGDEEFDELVQSISYRIRAARDVGEDVPGDLLHLRCELLVEQALRRQEAEGRL